MKKVIFNTKTMDSATRKEYAVSKDGVEVSDDFAARLAVHPQHGVSFEVEGVEIKKTTEIDTEKSQLREDYILLMGEKPGNKSVETMRADMNAKQVSDDSARLAAEIEANKNKK